MKREQFNLQRLFKLILMIPLVAIIGINCDSDNNISDNNEFDTVLDVANANDELTTLVGLASDAGISDALDSDGPITLFAPSNQAFENLPEGNLNNFTNQDLEKILSYHVLTERINSTDLAAEQTDISAIGEPLYITVDSSATVTLNGRADVTQEDIQALNGTIHIIDEVLLPNSFIDVASIASKDYKLNTLVTLLSQSELVSTLENADNSFTVFAPINEAFESVQSTLDELSAEQVRQVLLYHVAAGNALSSVDLTDGQTIITEQGEELTVNIDNEGNVSLNNSVNVIAVNREGTNGIVHVIDGVLLPPSFQ